VPTTTNQKGLVMMEYGKKKKGYSKPEKSMGDMADSYPQMSDDDDKKAKKKALKELMKKSKRS
jgi:hypothetical protein